MVRLIRLEYLKLRANKALWILLGLYLACLILVFFLGGIVLKLLAASGMEYEGLDPTMLPIYDFEDIWHNFTWLGSFFKLFPAFLIIISICNEFSFKTHRQNVIDGLSRMEFILSKLLFSVFLALVSTGVIFVLSCILGGMNASAKTFEAFTYGIHFLGLHFFQLFLYFLFVLFVALLIRKSAITIVLVILYTLLIEPILAGALGFWVPHISSLFPLNAIDNLIVFPFKRYIFMNTPEYVTAKTFMIAGGWGMIFASGIYYQLKKRDF